MKATSRLQYLDVRRKESVRGQGHGPGPEDESRSEDDSGLVRVAVQKGFFRPPLPREVSVSPDRESTLTRRRWIILFCQQLLTLVGRTPVSCSPQS